MSKTPLISVIVPIYNVEQYLNRCIESVVNQTYTNLEIILVDDGSPDYCPQMCDEWAIKDNRVKVLHKENGGLSDARNAGIKVSNGEFICFIDSDDWFELNAIELMYKQMHVHECDVCSVGVIMRWNNGDSKALTYSHKEIVLDNTEKILHSFLTGEIIQTVWNKMYRKSVIKDFEFPVGKIYEDEFWSWKVMANSNRLAFIDNYLYNYFQNDQSIMHGGAKFKPLFVVEAGNEKVEYIAENYPRLRDLACEKYLYSCLFLSQRTLLSFSKKEAKAIIKIIKKYTRDKLPSDEYLYSFGIKRYLRVKSIYYGFEYVSYIQNLINAGNDSNI